MSMADVGGSFTRPEHVLNLGEGARNDHSGFGNSIFPPVENTRPGDAPVANQPTTPTSVAAGGAAGGTAASLISASGDNVATGGVEPIDATTTTSTPTAVAAGEP